MKQRWLRVWRRVRSGVRYGTLASGKGIYSALPVVGVSCLAVGGFTIALPAGWIVLGLGAFVLVHVYSDK